jgi:hypothetical protein
MTPATDFLHEAYLHIEAGNAPYARALLESLVSMDPLNVEAWEAHMQICPTCEELDELCDRVLQVRELTPAERESLLDYYYFLRQGLKAQQTQSLITFELVDQFTYTLKEQAPVQPASSNAGFSIKHLFEGWLEKAIAALYLLLLLTGFKLIAIGMQFGYWILLMLAFSIFINLWNMLFPENKKPSHTKRTSTLDKRPDTRPSRIPS